jgi:Predicted N-acetylglucosamine kinase
MLKNKGIIVILGTGSLVAAYDNNGNYIRAGNWGHIIGDEGSAYKIAIRALNYIMKIYDGRLGFSPIVDEIIRFLKIKDLSEISTIIYTDLKNEEIAKLAPTFIQFASKDNFLFKIIKEEAEEIVNAIKAVYSKVNYKNIYLTGGLTRSKKTKLYIDLIKEGVKRSLPECKVKVAEVHPVIGSIVIALKEENVEISHKEYVRMTKELNILLRQIH